MKILLVGSGGREHAMARKLFESAHKPELHFAPGNPGFHSLGRLHPVASDDVEGLVRLACELAVDFVLVGPEIPLALGLVDRLEAAGVKALGPTQAAARIEASKAFSKDLMARYGVPTAAYLNFTEFEPLMAHLTECPVPVVVKASGLAAGKGAVVCMTREEALEAGRSMLGPDRQFGEAGDEVVVEEFMTGEEASVFALCDGSSYVLLPSAQDHKRIFDNDQGPNTGGMGAYSPAPRATPQVLATICQSVIEPTLKGMELEGCPFKGFLFVGIMLTKAGPKVVEFNCRMGDPETQVVMSVLEADFVDLCLAAIEGKLSEVRVPSPRRHAAVIVMASEGYPNSYPKGRTISGLLEAGSLENVRVYHAGTALDSEGQVVTAGGRVLGVTALGETLKEAVDRAYEAADKISFQGMQFRRDIAQKGLAAWAEAANS